MRQRDIVVKQMDGIEKEQNAIVLKVEESVVDDDNPWGDDVLGREQIAARLTNLIGNQSSPLTISIHGAWGTGKTFMLKRWQQDLQNQQFKAIYFNAWEDDFCADPLLSIIGQMWDYFEKDKGSKVKRLAISVKEKAVPLVWANVKSVVSNKTGLTLETGEDKDTEQDLIDNYLVQTRTRAELKKRLGEMAAEVSGESGQPLVFIIDELDRCRPTFAIELLERVKHIFDVPNMVFVLGINRDELCKALSSVYGDIETDIYLRRFFDFEFNLSEVDSQRYITNLIERLQLVDAFEGLSELSSKEVHVRDYDNYVRVFPKLWSALGLSLRDTDYGIRLLAVLSRNVKPGNFTHPFLLSVLIAMKFKRPEFYRSLIAGNYESSEVMNYIDDELKQDQVDEELTRYLDRIEGFLYCANSSNDEGRPRGQTAASELLQTQDVQYLPGASPLSYRAQKANGQQRRRILLAISDGQQMDIDGSILGNLAALIDTFQTQSL